MTRGPAPTQASREKCPRDAALATSAPEPLLHALSRLPDGALITTSEGELLFANQAAEELLARPADRLHSPATLADLTADREQAFMLSEALRAQGRLEDTAVRFTREEGPPLDLRLDAHVLTSESAAAHRLIWFLRDASSGDRDAGRGDVGSVALEAIDRVLECSLASASKEALAREVLTAALQLTDSRSGFLGEINAEGRLDVIACDDPAGNPSGAPNDQLFSQIDDLEARGLLDDVVRSGRTLCVELPLENTQTTTPPSAHPAIERLLAVPLIRDDSTTGILCLANRATPYRDADKVALEQFARAAQRSLLDRRAKINTATMQTERERRVVDRMRKPDYRAETLQAQTTANKAIREDLKASRMDRNRLLFELQERVKELHCLHEAAQLLECDDLTLAEQLQRIAERIPDALQFPAAMSCRLLYDEQEFCSGPHPESPWCLSVPIAVNSIDCGMIEVRYHGDPLPDGSTPFLTEERTLLDSLSNLISSKLDRATAVQQLAAHERRLQTVLDAAPGVIYVADPKTYEVIFVNRAFRDLLAEDPTGRRCFEAFQGRDAPCPFCTNEILFRTHQPYQWEFHNPVLDRHFHIVDRLIDWPDGRTVRFEQAIDITDRKRAEAEREQLTERLTRSNEELEQFAYIASHDLQEPLRMVASYVQLLERRYKGKLDSDADEFIDYAVDGAMRMKTLINDLLAYSRVSSRARPSEAVDTSALVRDVMASLDLTIQETNARIEVGDLPIVSADPTQLWQLFQNLLSNALKFSGEADPVLGIQAERDGDWWRFAVQDNGIGIAKEHQSQVFQIFQRLHSKSSYPGTGIGLAVVKRIVERHGGRIWVESAPGKGSTFHFTLPAMEG